MGELDDDVASILRSALVGDPDGVVNRFDDVLDKKGMGGAYDLAWGLAARMVGRRVQQGPWRLDFPGIDEAGYDVRWVARFVSAYANADPPTAEALFGAALADGQLPDCLLMLAGSTIATLRRRGE